MTSQGRQGAVLLLGPTGSGKTPLGDFLEAHALWGKKCLHFDFGATMRSAVGSPSQHPRLSPDNIQFLKKVLSSGALLEDKDFPIAKTLFQSFLATTDMTPDNLVIMNGLPRHLDQAMAIQPLVEIKAVIYLKCSPAVVLERIRNNTGGDRQERADDSMEAIRDKLQVFEERTRPLTRYYTHQQIRVLNLEVRVTTSAGDLARELAKLTDVI